MICESKIFMNNRTQNVRLPANMRYPANVKQVIVRSNGNERIITPIENMWDSFFLSNCNVSDDFLTERSEQKVDIRENFDD